MNIEFTCIYLIEVLLKHVILFLDVHTVDLQYKPLVFLLWMSVFMFLQYLFTLFHKMTKVDIYVCKYNLKALFKYHIKESA